MNTSHFSFIHFHSIFVAQVQDLLVETIKVGFSWDYQFGRTVTNLSPPDDNSSFVLLFQCDIPRKNYIVGSSFMEQTGLNWMGYLEGIFPADDEASQTYVHLPLYPRNLAECIAAAPYITLLPSSFSDVKNCTNRSLIWSTSCWNLKYVFKSCKPNVFSLLIKLDTEPKTKSLFSTCDA